MKVGIMKKKNNNLVSVDHLSGLDQGMTGTECGTWFCRRQTRQGASGKQGQASPRRPEPPGVLDPAKRLAEQARPRPGLSPAPDGSPHDVCALTSRRRPRVLTPSLSAMVHRPPLLLFSRLLECHRANIAGKKNDEQKNEYFNSNKLAICSSDHVGRPWSSWFRRRLQE